MFGVKDPIPRGLRAGVVCKFLCAGCNACYNLQSGVFFFKGEGELPGIFPRAYVSTCSVIGPLTFLNTYKILSNAALYALMTVPAS